MEMFYYPAQQPPSGNCYVGGCTGVPVTCAYWFWYRAGICGAHVIAQKLTRTKTWWWY